jgi:peptidoglycan/LPS O-acetylase OafA/YrhL
MTANPAQPRFLALDALRGVLALLVVLFHLPVASHVRDLAAGHARLSGGRLFLCPVQDL